MLRVIQLLVGIALAGVCASAEPITYTFSVLCAGRVGSTLFASQFVTFTVTTDTSSITAVGSTQRTPPIVDATVTIPIIGTGTLTNPAIVQAVPSSVLLIFDGTILVSSPELANYDLTKPIGPILSPFGVGPTPIATSLGTLIFQGGPVTFTAALAPASTPLPSLITLTLTGLAVCILYTVRRRFVAAN